MQVILSKATATGAGAPVTPRRSNVTFQATGMTTADAGAAGIDIEVSNDGTSWLVETSIALTLSTTAATAGYEMDAAWTYVRANVTSISGTGAAVSVSMGGGA